MPVGLSKNYKEAAEAIKKYLKNVKVKKRTDKKVSVIEVIGDYKKFSITDMDIIGGRMKFEFRDAGAKTESERKMRGEMAMNNPQVAAMFTSQTVMFVYKQVEVKTTITEDGKVSKEEVKKKWKECTREWITKEQKDRAFLQ